MSVLDSVDLNSVDEVVVALPDLLGRLQGSGVSVEDFRTRVQQDGLDVCAYLLDTDVEMQPIGSPAIGAVEHGFGDFRLLPDGATLRRMPWRDGSALVLADAVWPDGRPVEVAPRRVLRRQLDRLAERGWTAQVGTELELLVFRESYQEAWDRDYAGLRPTTRYNVDYSLQGTSDLDPLMGRLRRSMRDAGLVVESARAECHPGQYEIVFRYAEAMRSCDDAVLYKTTAKNLAAEAGLALTFMAKFDGGEGNSCHVHVSLRDADGRPVLALPAEPGRPSLLESFVAGQLTCLTEFALLFAPTLNSYKRLQPGGFAPTTVGWGRDNRTCPVRVVGEGLSLRIEHRVPGGDANPYLAVAGIVAAGLFGIENGLVPPEPVEGAASEQGEPLPRSLREAVQRWRASSLAEQAFGAAVVDHYARAAEAELAAFDAVVTDWERRRCFERI